MTESTKKRTYTRVYGPMAVRVTVNVDEALLLGIGEDPQGTSRDAVRAHIEAALGVALANLRRNGQVDIDEREKGAKLAKAKALREELRALEGELEQDAMAAEAMEAG